MINKSMKGIFCAKIHKFFVKKNCSHEWKVKKTIVWNCWMAKKIVCWLTKMETPSRKIMVRPKYKNYNQGTSERLGIWYGYSIETIVCIVS